MSTQYSDHFTYEELACPKTGIVQLQPGFIDDLELFRVTYNNPVYPTSCCRSEDHNASIGGHERSLHMFNNPYWKIDTIAIDVKRPADELLHYMIKAALLLDWTVRIYARHVHLDKRNKYLDLPSRFTIVE